MITNTLVLTMLQILDPPNEVWTTIYNTQVYFMENKSRSYSGIKKQASIKSLTIIKLSQIPVMV